MKLLIHQLVVVALLVSPAVGQAFTPQNFVGTGEGQYTSTTFGGVQLDMTLGYEDDGFNTDSSGHLVPPYYFPDTQNWKFDEATNRLHFWYLDTVYTDSVSINIFTVKL